MESMSTIVTNWNPKWELNSSTLTNNQFDLQFASNNTPPIFGETFFKAQFVVILFTAILAIPGNLIFVLVTTFSPNLHNVTSFLLVHLASVDLILMVVMLCNAAHWNLNSNDLDLLIWCSAIGLLVNLCYGLKTWNLMFICIDQHIWINKPLRYHQMMTKRKTIIIIISLWIVTVLVVSLPLLNGDNYKFHSDILSCLHHPSKVFQMVNFTYCILIPIVMSCRYYIQVAKATWKQANRRVIICNKINCSYVRRSKTDFKIIKCLVFTGGFYILCWIPGLFTSTLALTSVPVSPYMQLTSQSILCLSIAIAPVVQYMYNSRFHKATVQIWGRLLAMCPRQQQTRIRVLRLGDQRQGIETERNTLSTVGCSQNFSKRSCPQRLVRETAFHV